MHGHGARHLDRLGRAARSGRRARRAARRGAGRAPREPKYAGDSFWSAGPGREQVAQPQHGAEKARPGLLHAGALRRQLADRAVEAADRRHRMGRVERESPRLGLGGRQVGRQRAVAVEVVRRLRRPRRRPLPLVAPAAAVVELPSAVLRPLPPPITKMRTGASPSGWPVASSGSQRSKNSSCSSKYRCTPQVLCGPKSTSWQKRRIAAHPDVAPGPDHEPLRRLVLRRHRGEVLGVGVPGTGRTSRSRTSPGMSACWSQ